MKLGRIVGKVWATKKDPQLEGVKLYIMQPINEKLDPVGRPLIAADTVGAGYHDIIYWVSGREATFGFPDKKIPSDVTIIGIVDDTQLSSRELVEKRRKEWLAKNFSR